MGARADGAHASYPLQEQFVRHLAGVDHRRAHRHFPAKNGLFPCPEPDEAGLVKTNKHGYSGIRSVEFVGMSTGINSVMSGRSSDDWSGYGRGGVTC